MGKRNPYQPSTPRGLPPTGAPIFVEVTRGTEVESVHRVHAVVCDSAGSVVECWGDSELTLFPRSAVKMIQALPMIEAGHHEKHHLDQRHLALACASHHGELRHVNLVSEWLERIGLKSAALECGAQEPVNEGARRDLWRAGHVGCPVHNNCSGKHAGMLTGCVAEGLPVPGYTGEDHPWQRRVRQALDDFLGLRLQQAPWGIDGCGLPTWRVPLRSLALAASRIADPGRLSWASSLRALRNAVVAEPWMLGGEESLCSKLVANSQGEVIVKVGAEGVYLCSLPRLGLGMALKAECGSVRAVETVLLELLRARGIAPLGADWIPVKRWTGETVGEIRVRV